MSSSQEVQKRRLAAVPRGVVTATSVCADRAENAEIWDVEGRRYIDFASGIGVLAVGHRHPKVLEAVHAQMTRFTHTGFQVMSYEPYIYLAERLNELAPFSGTAKTVFFTTGAEATENAVRIARTATHRPSVITFTGAFHGRTAMASTLTGKVVPYKRVTGVSVPNIFHVPFPSEFTGVTVQDCLRALDFVFAADVDPEQVAAIMIEPVQGEGGFNVAPTELLLALRQICTRYGILLIADEVQSGFGRTGLMFAIEHSCVEPDLVTIAKSLGGGFPLSGVIGRSGLMDSVEPGGLGGTYAGSPISCAAALAVLDIIQEEGLLERARAIGAKLVPRIEGWMSRNDLCPIAGLRGYGAMLGFDVVKERGKTDPDGDGAKAVCKRALDAGLVILTCGRSGETLRILTPLTASDAVIDEGLDCLEVALGII